MKIHLVYDEDYLEQLKEMLESAGHDIVEWDYSIPQFSDFSQKKQTVAEVAIVDAQAGIVEKKEILNLLKTVRKNLPKLRIVLILPESIEKDEAFINKLLTLSIYDMYFIDEYELDDLEKWLNNPKSYANYNIETKDVKGNLEGRAKITSEKEERKQTVYLEKIIGTGFICVVGARRGVGATTIAVAIANYLATNAKKKVALVELNHYPILSWAKGLHRNVDIFTQGEESFNLYLEEIKNPLDEIACQEYDFVVLDMGVVFEPEMDKEKRKDIKLLRVHKYRGEISRANLTVMVTRSGQWDYLFLEPYLRKMEKALASWTLLTVGDPGKKNKNALEEKVDRVITTPHISNPLSSELETFLSKLLQPLLPQSSKKKRNWPLKANSFLKYLPGNK